MDRWQRWEESGKRREEERTSKKRQSQKREDPGARKIRKVAKQCVVSMICGSGGSKSRLAKAAGAEEVSQNSFVPHIDHSLTHSLTHSFSLCHSLTHITHSFSLGHSLTYSLTHSLTYSLTHSLTSFTFTHITHSFTLTHSHSPHSPHSLTPLTHLVFAVGAAFGALQGVGCTPWRPLVSAAFCVAGAAFGALQGVRWSAKFNWSESTDLKFNWFEFQLISDSIDLKVNFFETQFFEIQLIWDSIYLRFNWFQLQLISTIDLRFNRFENKLIWNLISDSSWKLEKEVFLRDFLRKQSFEALKQSFSVRLPSKTELRRSKTKLFCKTSFKNRVSKLENKSFLRDFLQKWNFKTQKQSFSAKLPSKMELRARIGSQATTKGTQLLYVTGVGLQAHLVTIWSPNETAGYHLSLWCLAKPPCAFGPRSVGFGRVGFHQPLQQRVVSKWRKTCWTCMDIIPPHLLTLFETTSFSRPRIFERRPWLPWHFFIAKPIVTVPQPWDATGKGQSSLRQDHHHKKKPAAWCWACGNHEASHSIWIDMTQ